MNLSFGHNSGVCLCVMNLVALVATVSNSFAMNQNNGININWTIMLAGITRDLHLTKKHPWKKEFINKSWERLCENCDNYADRIYVVIIMPIAFTLWLQLPWLRRRWLPAFPYIEFGAAGPHLFSQCSAAVVLVPLTASLRVLTYCFYCSVLVF